MSGQCPENPNLLLLTFLQVERLRLPPLVDLTFGKRKNIVEEFTQVL